MQKFLPNVQFKLVTIQCAVCCFVCVETVVSRKKVPTFLSLCESNSYAVTGTV